MFRVNTYNILLILALALLNYFTNGHEIFYATYEANGEIKINSGNISNNDVWTVKGIYKNLINESGFAYLEIETNSNFSDSNQSYTAGILESYLTGDIIYSHWYNTIKDFRDTMDQDVIKKIDNFLQRNSKWIHKQLHHKTSPYWYQLSLIYNQIRGIYDGYNKYWGTKFEKLKWNDVLWLNLFYDVRDLYDAFGGDKIIGDGHCSVLIKIMPNNSDIYFGHNTWVSYQTMLRVMKKYTLNYNISNSIHEKIPGFQTTFSSYPGTIGSQDDFYLISSGLAVTETTNEVFNKTLWLNSLSSENTVFESIRSVIANRLAISGETWCNTVKLYNSGTYNNQWMIFDYKKFKNGRPPQTGAFWVIEQAPTISVSKDLTDVLIKRGYWSSYNIPYYKEIYEVTDYNSMLEKYGNWFSHDNAPRAKIFERDYHNVHDMNSFMSLMRSNNYQLEPFAQCRCDPPYSAAGAIAARNDLNPVNGTFQFKGQSHRPSGATDAKITNSDLFPNLQFIIVSGPSTGTNGKLPMFQWSTSDFKNTPRRSHPDVWNFKPVLLKWSM